MTNLLIKINISIFFKIKIKNFKQINLKINYKKKLFKLIG